MRNIKDTVDYTLGFHGKQPDPISNSIVDALEMREAQIQADLVKIAVDLGLDEDRTLDTLHYVFMHSESDATGSLDERLDSILRLTRLLAQQASDLADQMAAIR